MPTRDSAPIGSPCWTDLWTSDVEGSRRFYSELFGWEAQEPSPEFGGYFMFTSKGVPVAGAMGDMGEMPADNVWKIYLDTDDIVRTPFPHIWGPFHVPHPSARSALRISSRSSSVTSSRSRRAALIRGR